VTLVVRARRVLLPDGGRAATVQVARWMSAAPARLAGLPQKGAIAVGRDADLVAFAPEERWRVGGLLHRNPVTPYAGRELTGVVRRTWLRGRETDGTPRGRLLSRGGR
jgi:allantoinase